MRRVATGAALAVLVAGALAVAGCGGGDDSSSEASATGENEAAEPNPADASTVASGGGKNLEIKMSDYAFDPSAAQTSAGKVTISAPNEGAVVHELVLIKSDADAAALPTLSNGEVDEDQLEADGQVVGEIPDVDPNATKKATFDLDPGRYVMFCNLPGHYAQGMYGTVDVTG